jgi:hypothetical protein
MTVRIMQKFVTVKMTKITLAVLPEGAGVDEPSTSMFNRTL